jgi:hypothetical protein
MSVRKWHPTVGSKMRPQRFYQKDGFGLIELIVYFAEGCITGTVNETVHLNG